MNNLRYQALKSKKKTKKYLTTGLTTLQQFAVQKMLPICLCLLKIESSEISSGLQKHL